MKHYAFNIGDYAASTRHLSETEDLAYRRLIDLYYRIEEALPLDHHQVARLIRMKAQAAKVLYVLETYFTPTHGRRTLQDARPERRQRRQRSHLQRTCNGYLY